MLVEFQVADNKLEGKLPEHLCDNGKLVGVVAFNNNLTNELPRCKFLDSLSLNRRLNFIDQERVQSNT